MSAETATVVRIAAPAQEAPGHKQVETETRMLIQALRSVREAVSITDMQDNVLFVNESFRKMYGFSEEELKGKPIAVVRSPNNPPEVMREIPLATARGGWEGEVWNCRRDGTEFLISLTTAPVRDEDGQTIARIGIASDVTERKRAEAALQESEEQFRTMTTAAQDAIIMMDNEGRISFWNAAAERIFGYPKAEVIGQDLHHLLVPAASGEEFHRAFPRWRETGAGCAVGKTVELAAVRKDGTEFPVELSLSSVHRKDRWSALGIIRDITGRKRAEDEVCQANEKLSALVQKLEIRGVQEGLLSEMRMFLQACSSTQEIAPVIAHSMQRLFPNSDGALFLLSPSKTDLETAVRWGDFPEEPDENVFSPDACWGLRRGGIYVVDDVKSGLICPHMRHLPATAYACLPLMAKSEVLGLLHLRPRLAPQRAEALEMIAAVKDMASILSELLSMSISNLRLSETLSIQSIRDPLTGLFNRRYMEETLQREIYRAARRQNQVGVVMADIDHFKRFNDLHGHAAGDLVLTELAGFLRSRTREVDIPCRYGGEEFTLVFTESSLEDTIKRANQLKEEVKDLKLRYGGQEIGPIALSMGVSAYPANGTKPEELLHAADAALYRAKQAGRDRVISAGAL